MSERTHKGFGVGSQAVEGPALRVIAPSAEVVAPLARGEVAARLPEALAALANELDDESLAHGGEIGEILAALAVIARDPTLPDKLLAGADADQITPHELARGFDLVARDLRQLGGYLGARADDITELGARTIARVFGLPETSIDAILDQATPATILVMDALSASQASQLDPARIGGIVVASGGPTGHVALILRAKRVPALVGAPTATTITTGTPLALDPAAGVVVEYPVAGAHDRLTLKRVARPTRRSVIARGEVELLANVGSAADAIEAAELGAGGIGLVRTEFLYLGREAAPSIEEQVQAYRAIVAPFEGSRAHIVFRTLDSAPDKRLDFASLADDENPALGERGIRIAARHPELLEGQLRALAMTTSPHGPEIWVMAPMVTTAAEAKGFAGRCREAGLVQIGAMIEVPAAALDITRVLAPLAFASIGTNDLAQYLMAADRNAVALGALLDPWQPVLLRLVAAVARTGRQLGRPIGVCGEAASDPMLAAVLVGLGVTSLSMPPSALGEVRELLETVSRAATIRLARSATEAPDADTARQAVRDELAKG